MNIEQDIEYHRKAKYSLDLANIKLMSKKSANQLQIVCKYFEESNSRKLKTTERQWERTLRS